MTDQRATLWHAGGLTWALRVAWFLTVFTTGEVVAAGVADRSTPVAVTTAALAWVVWAAGLGASAVLSPRTLTLFRLLAPLPLTAVIVVAVTGAMPRTLLATLGIVTAVVVAVIAAAAEVGADFVDGVSYGDERRLPLRAPGPLLVGPIQLVWLAAVPLPLAGVLALAAQAWLPGTLMVAAGLAAARFGIPALDRLTRRWAVMVPAGLTIVDPLTLVDPILLPRTSVRALGPAISDAGAVDLTAGAPGLVLRADLSDPVEPSVLEGRRNARPPTPTHAVLFSPSRPGRLLAVAEARGLRVQRGAATATPPPSTSSPS